MWLLLLFFIFDRGIFVVYDRVNRFGKKQPPKKLLSKKTVLREPPGRGSFHCIIVCGYAITPLSLAYAVLKILYNRSKKRPSSWVVFYVNELLTGLFLISSNLGE